MSTPPSRSWITHTSDPDLCEHLTRRLGVSTLMAHILVSRGFGEGQSAQTFLNPRLEDVPDPFTLPDMMKAVLRIEAAISSSQSIVIYGDYDVDGTSGAAILLATLRQLGARVQAYLPHRERDGYGLLVPPLKRLVEQGAQLIITCDNGTSSHEAIHWAATRGVDVIVTDHHSLPDPLPDAAAVINPRRLDCPEVWRPLSGAGLAFMLVAALRRHLKAKGGLAEGLNLKRYLDLVTLGTIADVVPLVGINRVLVYHGLVELAARRRPGLAALLEVAGVKEGVTTAETVSFRLAPRLNAAGRLAEASLAVDLMVTENEWDARRLAKQLDQLNRDRQQVEEEVLVEAVAQLEEQRRAGERPGYVVAGEGWHPGVIGIVAARLVELTHRPVFVLSIQGGEGKGSGRSIRGLDLFAALEDCHALLGRYGGHPMAAGLSLDASRVEEFRRRFEAFCAAQLTPDLLQPELPIDAWVELDQLTVETVAEIAQLGPFGCGNPEPVLACAGVAVDDTRLVGGGEHLRLRLKGQTRYMAAIAFRGKSLAARIPSDRRVDVAHHIQLNHWNGKTNLQMLLCDLRPVVSRG